MIMQYIFNNNIIIFQIGPSRLANSNVIQNSGNIVGIQGHNAREGSANSNIASKLLHQALSGSSTTTNISAKQKMIGLSNNNDNLIQQLSEKKQQLIFSQNERSRKKNSVMEQVRLANFISPSNKNLILPGSSVQPAFHNQKEKENQKSARSMSKKKEIDQGYANNSKFSASKKKVLSEKKIIPAAYQNVTAKFMPSSVSSGTQSTKGFKKLGTLSNQNKLL